MKSIIRQLETLEKQKAGNLKQLMGVFGSGRSGSSWLGSILDSHPMVAYRFEPFHRLQHNADVSRLRKRLEEKSCSDSDLIQVYDILLPANSHIERPPFFSKTNSLFFGKSWLRPAACRFKSLNALYMQIYTPRQHPALIFKEVTMEPMMRNLLKCTTMPLVYLVRHPCAVISSTLDGQKQGVMPSGRHSVLTSLLNKHEPRLAEKYGSQVALMNPLEKEALLWRIDVEKGIAACRKSDKALVVLYEKLCDDPEGISTQIFNHFSLSISSHTLNYLDNFIQTQRKKLKRRHEFGIKPYFSVMRNPATMKNRWKEKLSPDEKKKIFALVEDSEAFQYCASRGRWD